MFSYIISYMKVMIHTDGACSGNQNEENIGGWGAVLEYGPHEKEICGGEINTTNNRMEMTALLEAFRALKKPGLEIDVFCDSSYLMDCFRKGWYRNWLRNGWKTASKKPVENRDLWEALLPYISEHDITFFRVKGHVNLDHPSTNAEKLYEKFKEWNGSEMTYENFEHATRMNNRADALANKGMDEFR